MHPTSPTGGWSRYQTITLDGAANIIMPGDATRGRLVLEGFEFQVTLGATAQTLALEWNNGLTARRIRRYPLAASVTTTQQCTPIRVLAPARRDVHEDGTADAAVTFGATSLTDTRVAWEVNRFAGLVVRADSKIAVIASNTATALTVPSWKGGTPANGSAYTIRPPDKSATDQGTSSGSGATSLTDASKAWVVDAYVGRMVYAGSSNGTISRGTIIGNTATVLTIVAWDGPTPPTVSFYTIDEVSDSLRVTVTNGTNPPTFAEILAYGSFDSKAGAHSGNTPP